LLESAVTTAVVFLLIATSVAMSWVLALEEVPQAVGAGLAGLTDDPVVLLLLVNLLLLVAGTFMDMTPAVLVFTPILWPVVERIGMHPVHFGIVLIANLCIGLCTPPVGTCLFVGCGVGKTSIAKVTPAALPFFLAMVLALLLITFVPGLSLWLPELLGAG
jgi:tripartite ATP-independent transporter DctM subunit